MKHIFLVIAALCVMFPTFTATAAHAQSATQPATSDQWISHQMNQPPPGAARITSTSQERLDEIRRLYELAKREAQAGSRQGSADAE
ncbi:MAG: hypothetical protein RDU20_08180 [Desulfomonilaceae bacterium]|nr:hypothetical protein [Desulfomonilaceae bacterium]